MRFFALVRWHRSLPLLAVLCCLCAGTAGAFELGHYQPGVLNIRDVVMPPPGEYYEHYNIFYSADEFRDRDGKAINQLTIGNQTLDVETEIDVFVTAPVFLWVSPYKVLGAQYGAYINPTFGNASVSAAASLFGRGVAIDEDQWGFGDLFLQPLWLGWHHPYFDATFGYGMYMPTGKYDEGAADNIGLGFWTHQLQFSTVAYLQKIQATGVMLTMTYEMHGDKDEVDIAPGNNFALDWGVSQYLSETFEVGLSGYDSWQVTEDGGADVALIDAGIKDQVHAIGAQLSYWPIKMKFNIAGRMLWENGARNRFQGQLGTLTATYIF